MDHEECDGEKLDHEECDGKKFDHEECDCKKFDHDLCSGASKGDRSERAAAMRRIGSVHRSSAPVK